MGAIALQPSIQVTTAQVGAVDDVQVSPPVFWHTTAAQVNAESGSSIDAGRYNEATQEVSSRPEPMLQDTYIDGTAGLTGRAFTVTSGTVKDDWVSAWSGKRALLMTDGSSGAGFDVIDTTSAAQMYHSLIVIGRGPIAVAGTHSSDSANAYLELNSGSPDGAGYRIALEWARPIALQYRPSGAAAWATVAATRRIGTCEQYLEANARRIALHIVPDLDRNVMIVEVGEGNFLRHAPALGIPPYEAYRFSGAEGWAHMEVHPLRYPAVQWTKAARSVPPGTDPRRGWVIANSTGRYAAPGDATAEWTLTPDNKLGYQATLSNADAGEGLGSYYPPALSDVSVYIDSVWTPVYTYAPTMEQPPVMHLWHREVWDDITRTGVATDRLVIRNRDSRFSGRFANMAVNIQAANGSTWGQLLRGIIAPGVSTQRQDPVRLATCMAQDFSYKLGVPLGEEVVLDGWCIYDAVHVLLDIGQIAPKYRQTIPRYRPGPADAACPYPILGRGLGMNPVHRYDPSRTAISVLLELANEYGVVGWYGENIPFWFWFDALGQARFEPVDPRLQMPVAYFSDTGTGPYAIYDIEVYNSTEQMRTDLHLQGADPYTGELLHLHMPMPWNLPSVGYRYVWFERNPQWVSEAYLSRIATAATYQASLPIQTVKLRVPASPMIHAGQKIVISEAQALRRTGEFVILQLNERMGLKDVTGYRGEMECEMELLCRAVENLIPY